MLKVPCKKTLFKIIYISVAVIAVLAIAIGDVFYRQSVELYTSSDIAMGSAVITKVYGARGELACKNIEERIASLDTDILTARKSSSEISAINDCAGKHSVEVSDELLRYLNLCFDVANRTNGAFNPLMGALIDAWGFEVDSGEQEIPSAVLIEHRKTLCDYTKIQIDGNNVYLPEKGMKLNLGAAGKGIACDIAVEELERLGGGITGAVVSVGGSVATFGKNSSSDSFKVAIRNPNGAISDTIANITLNGTCFVSTSGSYEKYFYKGGVKYHHILDYSTGMPVSTKLASVTVVAPSGILSDVLSTACFASELDDAVAVLSEYGCEAVFIYEDFSVKITAGLENSFEITNSDYSNVEVLKMQ